MTRFIRTDRGVLVNVDAIVSVAAEPLHRHPEADGPRWELRAETTEGGMVVIDSARDIPNGGTAAWFREWIERDDPDSFSGERVNVVVVR